MPGNSPTYEFDPSGTNPANLITNENHTVTAASSKNLSFFIPRAAPFFRDNVILVRVNGAVETPLVEGQDYVFALRYAEASTQTSKQVYGGIAFLNRTFSGSVRIKQYRTIGGDWVLDDYTAVEQLTDTLYSVRTVYWDQLVQYPSTFPPYNHDQTMDDATGWTEVIAKLEALRNTIESNPATGALAQLALHQIAPNAHTPANVGLGLVNNYATATVGQTQQGLREDLYVTPKGVAVAVADSAGALGPRTIEMTGDAIASQTFNVEDAPWPDIAVTVVDAYKGIDTRAYPSSSVRGPDPDVETLPVFITNHANSPAGTGTLADGTTRPQFFIVNMRLKVNTGDTNAYARAQIATEHRAIKTDGVARTFVRYREHTAPFAWSAWTLISGQDTFTTYGRVTGTGSANGNPDTVLDPVFKLKLISDLNGLPFGDYVITNSFDVGAGVAISTATPRVQMAYRIGAYAKSSVFMRYGIDNATFGRWVNVTGHGVMLATGSIDTLFEEGEYDQNSATTTDLTTLGYPVDGVGRLTVQRVGDGDPLTAINGCIRQTFEQTDTSASHTRRYETGVWGPWIQTRLPDGSVPPTALKTVPSVLGGGLVKTAADVRATLELGNLAEYTLIQSSAEPINPPAKCLWVVPMA